MLAAKVTQIVVPRAAHTRGQVLPPSGLAFDSSSTYCVLYLAEAMSEQGGERPSSLSEALVNTRPVEEERSFKEMSKTQQGVAVGGHPVGAVGEVAAALTSRRMLG